MENNRVLLGMSGGVDSSVSALLLKQNGYDVIGMTLELFAGSSCCNIDTYIDAKNVCNSIGVTHFTYDCKPQFNKCVIQDFIDCYSNSMKENLSNVYITFSMIDLNKINTVMDNLGEYFGNIEINTTSFKNIAKIRSSNVYEYQKAIDEYDMVDLYQLVTKLEPVNGDNKKLLDSIKEAVKYNSATDSYSNGISIYFPETV